MSKQLVIIGASGHGKVVADIVIKSGDQVVGFLDDNTLLGDSFIGFPVLGTVDKRVEYKDCSFVIAIGNAVIRERMAKSMDVDFYIAIHPDAVISDIDVSIGAGTVVMANAVVNSGTKIGSHCIINTGAVVEHGNRISDFVHVSVGAKLAGTVEVGKGTWIGIGATVSNNLNICGGCMLGAGAVVVKDIDKPGVYVGVPAERTEQICLRKIRGGYFTSIEISSYPITERVA